jgi:uncharacterized membrane protein YdbT with pleckstrin-like domain
MASYVDKVLIAGERVLHRGRISLWPFAWAIVLGVLLLPIVIGIAVLAWVWVKVKSTELAITNKRIIAKFGFVSRRTVEINLAKVEAIQVDQSVLGRMLDYGTIIVSGAGNPVAPIPSIADPLEFRHRFMEATDREQPAELHKLQELP